MLRSMQKRPFLKWPPFWPWEKFRMSLYPKNFPVECSISVPNLMLVSSIAQFSHISAGLVHILPPSRPHQPFRLTCRCKLSVYYTIPRFPCGWINYIQHADCRTVFWFASSRPGNRIGTGRTGQNLFRARPGLIFSARQGSGL